MTLDDELRTAQLKLRADRTDERIAALEQRLGVTPPVELPVATLEAAWDYDRTAKYYTRWGLLAGLVTGIVFGAGLGGWLA